MPRTRQVSGTVVLASSWASNTWRIRLGVSFGGPAKPDLPLTRDLHPSGAPLHQQVALKLGQDRQDTHHHLSSCRARVDVVHQRHEFCARALDLLHDLQQVKLGPGEAIQAVDNDLIPWP